MLDVLLVKFRIRILGVLCVDAGSDWRYWVVRCRFGSRDLEVRGPSIKQRRANHDVISVNRRMCKGTIVGTVTTFGIGGRTDVIGGASSGFSMMISHGQSCSNTGR